MVRTLLISLFAFVSGLWLGGMYPRSSATFRRSQSEASDSAANQSNSIRAQASTDAGSRRTTGLQELNGETVRPTALVGDHLGEMGQLGFSFPSGRRAPSARVHYRDFVGRRKVLDIDIEDGVGWASLAAGKYLLEWTAEGERGWRCLTVEIEKHWITEVTPGVLAAAPLVVPPPGFGTLDIVLRSLSGNGSHAAQVFVDGVDALGYRREDLVLDATGHGRVSLRVGTYRIRAGMWVRRIEVAEAATNQVDIRSDGFGELRISVPGPLFVGRWGGTMLAEGEICVIVEPEASRFLLLKPGWYRVLWGEGAFFLGRVRVDANRVSEPDLRLAEGKIALRFSGATGQSLDIWFKLEGGPPGFISPQNGIWSDRVPLGDKTGPYLITGLHPGEYRLTVSGGVRSRTLTLDAVSSPRPFDVASD